MAGATRRGLLRAAAVGGTGVASVLAGCSAAPAPAAVARAVTAHGKGLVAVGTAQDGGLTGRPARAWVARVDRDGAVTWTRSLAADGSGSVRPADCCRFGAGALLVGRRTGNARGDGVLHAVDASGAPRWRRTLEGPSRLVAAAASGDGAVLAGTTGDEPETGTWWVGRVDAGGELSWEHEGPRGAPATLHVEPDGGVVVGGHATAGDGVVPQVVAFGSDGRRRVARRYGDRAVLAGLGVVALLATDQGPLAVAAPPGGGATVRPRVQVLDVDESWRLRRSRRLAATDDIVRGVDGGNRVGSDAELVGAVSSSHGLLRAVVVEGAWTTVATVDVDLKRTREVTVPATAHAAAPTGFEHAPTGASGSTESSGRGAAERTVALAGARGRDDGGRDAWVARTGRTLRTTTVSAGDLRPSR